MYLQFAGVPHGLSIMIYVPAVCCLCTTWNGGFFIMYHQFVACLPRGTVDFLLCTTSLLLVYHVERWIFHYVPTVCSLMYRQFAGAPSGGCRGKNSCRHSLRQVGDSNALEQRILRNGRCR